MSLKLGLVVVGGGKLSGEHFRPFSPCSTPNSLESWQAAANSPLFFFPSLPPSFPSFPSHFSSSVSHPIFFFISSSLLLSCIHTSFLPFPLRFLCLFEGKQTITYGNDPLQTSTRWHHNNSRKAFPFSTFYHFQHRLRLKRLSKD